jgi:hypothetical protein
MKFLSVSSLISMERYFVRCSRHGTYDGKRSRGLPQLTVSRSHRQ